MTGKNNSEGPFEAHDPSFQEIIGTTPTLTKLLSNESYPFAHEAGVFFSDDDELWVTSNRIVDAKGQQEVKISKIILSSDRDATPRQEEVTIDAFHMGNGGVNYSEGILFCSQGSSTIPSGLYLTERKPPYRTEPMLTSLRGVPFNSVNDVIIARDGSIWFTDPPYGFEQGYKESPQLPAQVYRYDPKTKSIRALADGFGHPNGLCFSPDEETLYVTDTDQVHGTGAIRRDRASSIYAFSIDYYHGQPFLCNRRLFAFVEIGIPDGIKCDMQANVYSACGDGVHVWSPAGVLLGRIVVDGGSANFCFGKEGEVFILNEHHLWRAQLNKTVRGALLGI